MGRKRIYKHDGWLFANLEEEWTDYEEIEVDWKVQGQNSDVAQTINPILNHIDVIIHTTLDTKELNDCIKLLQIAVNRINKDGFYGK